MRKFWIDGIEVSFLEGESVLRAATRAGIRIPSLCNRKENNTGIDPEKGNSCMVCVVRMGNEGELLPSCSVPASDGLLVSTGDEVTTQRTMALEFLLSEHRGDCEGPCARVCPAGFDIPRILNLLEHGENEAAYTLMSDCVPMPGIVERICPAPCERACRRSRYDSKVRICDILTDISIPRPVMPQNQSEKSVGIYGTGPEAMGAMHVFRQKGIICHVVGESANPGNLMMQIAADHHIDALAAQTEIDAVFAHPVVYHLQQSGGGKNRIESIFRSCDSVLITESLPYEIQDSTLLKLKKNRGPVDVIRSLVEGRRAAIDICNTWNAATEVQVRYDSILFWSADDISLFAKTSDAYLQEMESIPLDVVLESARCLQCDCVAKQSCSLRSVADELAGTGAVYPRRESFPFSRSKGSSGFLHEPGKCIKCGACVRLGKELNLSDGPIFLRRGYDLIVSAVSGGTLGLAIAGHETDFAQICPTGAMAVRQRKAK